MAGSLSEARFKLTIKFSNAIHWRRTIATERVCQRFHVYCVEVTARTASCELWAVWAHQQGSLNALLTVLAVLAAQHVQTTTRFTLFTLCCFSSLSPIVCFEEKVLVILT